MHTPSPPGTLRWLLSNAGVAWIAVLLLMAVLVLNLRKWRRRHQSPMTNETPQPIFEIPDTAKSRAFMARNPKFPAAFVKLNRFLQFAAIQENRAMEAALKQVPRDQIDAEMGPENTVAETRKRYEQYKGNFKATACSVCGMKTPPSWDVDLVSMVQRWGTLHEGVPARIH